MRVPVVFDNLIPRGEMPVTIGVFIDPGIFASDHGRSRRSHRRRTGRRASLRLFAEALVQFSTLRAVLAG
jgi:hypothetical protein